MSATGRKRAFSQARRECLLCVGEQMPLFGAIPTPDHSIAWPEASENASHHFRIAG